jgi:hypothetical protein
MITTFDRRRSSYPPLLLEFDLELVGALAAGGSALCSSPDQPRDFDGRRTRVAPFIA